MRKSTVIGPSGDSIQDNIRTSYGAFLARRHDSIISSIEERLAAWTQLPMTHQEDLQACLQTCTQGLELWTHCHLHVISCTVQARDQNVRQCARSGGLDSVITCIKDILAAQTQPPMTH